METGGLHREKIDDAVGSVLYQDEERVQEGRGGKKMLGVFGEGGRRRGIRKGREVKKDAVWVLLRQNDRIKKRLRKREMEGREREREGGDVTSVFRREKKRCKKRERSEGSCCWENVETK